MTWDTDTVCRESQRCLPVSTVQFSRVILHLASFTVEPVNRQRLSRQI